MGELKIASHLNEPLEATIPLEDVKGIDPSDILTSLADNKAFVKAGLEPTGWINHIQFKVSPDKQGKLIIFLSTQHPVQDPFADLLIQVAWPGGKLIKEYTLLLDPPKIVTTQSKASSAKAQELLETFSAQSHQEAAPRQVASLVKQQFQPILSDAHDYEPIQFGGRFGPVQGETLWSIAKRLAQGSHFSVHQAVMAIAYKNPDAFTNGNINHIKPGAVLRLPTESEVGKYSQDSARQFVENQTNSGQSMVVYAQKTAPRERKTQPVAQKVSQNETATPKALKLVAPEHNQDKDVSIESTPAQNSNQQIVQTNVVAKDNSQRLTMVEEALDTLKRSNEEIAQKNAQLKNQNEVLVGELALKEQEINRLKMAADIHASTDEIHQSVAPKQSSTKATLPNEYAIVKQDPELTNKTLPVLEEVQHPEVAPQGATQLPKARKTNLNSHLDTSNDLASSQTKQTDVMKRNFLFIVFMFAFTCSILGWLWFSRHRIFVLADWANKKFKNLKPLKVADKSQYVSDLPQEEVQANFGLQFDLDKALNAVANEERKHLKPTVNTSLNKQEIDSLNKKSQSSLEDAEIYIAYERYQQAEKLLQEILTSETAQNSIYWDALLKLLELYVLTEKYTEYEKWVATIPSDLKDIAPKVWSKIKLLADKVEADKAVTPLKVVPLSLTPTDTTESTETKRSVDDDRIALATHHITDLPVDPEPLVQEQIITALPAKLELVSEDDEAFNSQIALARTYQDVGETALAREVLEKLLPTATGPQADLINKMLASINK